jgi:hypothetical protein
MHSVILTSELSGEIGIAFPVAVEVRVIQAGIAAEFRASVSREAAVA